MGLVPLAGAQPPNIVIGGILEFRWRYYQG